MSSRVLRVLAALVVLGALALSCFGSAAAAAPTGGLSSLAARGNALDFNAGAQSSAVKRKHHKKRKARCHRVRRKKGQKGHGRYRWVCKKKKPAGTPTGPAGPTGPGGGGSTPPPAEPEAPKCVVPGGRQLPPVPAGYELVDLIADNSFETSTAGFAASGGKSSVASTTTNPIECAKSLHVLNNEFDKVAFQRAYGYDQGPVADSVTARARLRIDAAAPAGRKLTVCAVVYFFEDSNQHTKCDTFSLNGSNVVEVFEKFNAEQKKLDRVFFQTSLVETGSVNFTLDDAHLFVVRKVGSEGDGGGEDKCKPAQEPAPKGPPNVNSPCDETDPPPATSPYTPSPINLPASRPVISLDSYKQIAATNPIFEKFKAFVDGVIATGAHADEYSPADGVIMFARTGDAKYINDAIAREQKTVTAATAKIAAGQAPVIAKDHFLDVGAGIEALALTYDYGYGLLNQAQREEWATYAETVISNLWSQRTATWGNKPTGSGADTGWAINDPGDNYYYSFIKATQMWALASKSVPWIGFLQTYKFPQIEAYFADLPGGGSREGTGYGVSQRVLWEDERIWRTSTGEGLAPVRTHARESVLYWLHATVPTYQYFAPIGDLSRVSQPEIFDYHVDLMHEAAGAASGTPEASAALWWLQHNKHQEGTEVGEIPHFRNNLRQALVTTTGTAAQPTALTYRAAGAGQFFGRSSWAENATWFQLTAGPFDQSHAHEEQGGISLYRNTWLAVTSNIWSKSGLQGGGGGGNLADLGTGVNNVVRFDKVGKAIPQNQSTATSVSTVSSETLGNGTVKVHADLTPAYRTHKTEVASWTRDLEFHENDLKVHDVCQVGSGVTPVFQLHVPVQPVSEGAGKVKAGALKLTFAPAYQVKFTEMTSFNQTPEQEFRKGWRIELTNPGGCGFDVDLEALAAP